MSNKAKPFYDLLGQIRSPITFRELIATCLRSIYRPDPASLQKLLPPFPAHLLNEVVVTEAQFAGIRCLIYSPTAKKENHPLVLYMHGGGFVIGCPEDTDYVTRMLCHNNQAVVVSVDYRLAPQVVFPGALDDCYNVLSAVVDQRSQLGIDTNAIFLAGDSAGGNLACTLSYRLAEHHLKIAGVILLSAWLDMAAEMYDSYNRIAPTDIVCDAAFLGYARGAYVGYEQWKNPLVSPIFGNIERLPPTIAIVGTADPLLDQTLKLKQLAQECKCTNIEVIVYDEMPHCFYLLPGLVEDEQDCFEKVSSFITKTVHVTTVYKS